MHRNEKGSALLAALVMMIVIGAMCAMISVSTVYTHRSANRTTDLQRAGRSARSALAYYAHRLEADPDYFTNTTVHTEVPLGDTSFILTSAIPGQSLNEWIVDITATANQVEYRILGVIDADELEFPQGLVLGGTGNSADDVLVMNGGTRFGSYDPAVGAGTLNDNASVWANGSVNLSGSATISGDLYASGWISSAGTSGSTGENMAHAPEFPLDPFEEYAAGIAADSLAGNDNGLLSGVFGTNWNALPGPNNFGDLNLSGGTYVLGAGTYRFREINLSGGAQLLLDTSGGPINLVVAGTAGVQLASGSQVQIDAGGTENLVTTVLEPGAPFSVSGGSLWGQEVNHPDAGGYCHLMSSGPGGKVAVQGSSRVHARLAAPSRDLFVGGDSEWYGSAMARTARFIGAGPKFLVDESLLGLTLIPTGEYELEAAWRGTVAP